MIQAMPKRVEKGSEWFVVGMGWIKKWQKWVYLDLLSTQTEGNEKDRAHPGKLECSDIIQPTSPRQIKEQAKKFVFQNAAMNHGLKEGTDFMLVDRPIIEAWQKLYNIDETNPPLMRYGIDLGENETIVELYLKKITFMPIPNKLLFKMTGPHHFYISRNETLHDLEKKAQRLLTNYLFFILKERSICVSKVRVWKSSTNNIDEIVEYDSKWKNYTHSKIDAELFSKMTETVENLNIADDDVLIVELPKDDGSFVFKSSKGQKMEEEKQVESVPSTFTLEELYSRDVKTVLSKSSKHGLVGLQNLGNTCFMNSGLQCLSNTVELSKYFLFGFYKGELNVDNPLGMKGKLAKAYAGLMKEIWLESGRSTAPWDLKKTLGSRIARFSGYGQQDAAELVNYLLDLIHEDLNRITKKPYVEISEEQDRSDEVVAKEYWDAYLARNQSIIVDLMYGQLKSTVTCLTCKNISTAFDPVLSIALPIKKGFVAFELVYVPARIHEFDAETGDYDVRYMPLTTFPVPAKATVREALEIFTQKLKIDVPVENLVVGNQRSFTISERFSHDTECAAIDQEREYTTVYEVNTQGLEKPVIVELNFFKTLSQGRTLRTDSIDSTPRFLAADAKTSIFEFKKQIAETLKGIFAEELTTDEQINNTIQLFIRDNLPFVT